MAIPSFVDAVTFWVVGGKGGNGCVSTHREKFRPFGGPDGGNGGHGGSVILQVESGRSSLVEYHRQVKRSGGNGQQGRGDQARGADGTDVLLGVPEGTVVSDADTGERLGDLTGAGHRFVVAAGGRGGLGNAALASAARKAPGFALLGEQGDARRITLELKVIADIGLVGYPSAGKSSLIAALSAARPQIADYPFTTVVPHLGVVDTGEQTFTVADVPGLIEGASGGRGLGHHFLRHLERCAAIVHVLDCATYDPGRDPLTDLRVIEAELSAYGGFDGVPRLVVLNKIDIPDGREMADLVHAEVAEHGWQVFDVSTKTGAGLQGLTFACAELVTQRRAAGPIAEPSRVVLRPEPVDHGEFSVHREGEFWRVRGRKPERWIHQTDFGNDEAVGYLADRLNRIGVEERLLELGAAAGDTVAIGGEDAVIFDFAPQVASGAEILSSRGDDHRLTEERPAARRRRMHDVLDDRAGSSEDRPDDDQSEHDEQR